MATRYETMLPSGGLFSLRGIVSEGLIHRAEQTGGIPTSGPGCYSIPKALENARRAATDPKVSTSKLQREQWNSNHRLNPFGR